MKAFPPFDIRVIIFHITVTGTGVVYRPLLVGPTCKIEPVHLSGISWDVRIQAFDSTNAQRMDYIIRGEAGS